MKYLVIGDMTQCAYSCDYYLFGIFDTEEEAISFIKNFENTAELRFDKRRPKSYIREYDGKTMYIGGYTE